MDIKKFRSMMLQKAKQGEIYGVIDGFEERGGVQFVRIRTPSGQILYRKRQSWMTIGAPYHERMTATGRGEIPF